MTDALGEVKCCKYRGLCPKFGMRQKLRPNMTSLAII